MFMKPVEGGLLGVPCDGADDSGPDEKPAECVEGAAETLRGGYTW